MEIQQLLESERASVALLRSIRLRHPNDVETLRMVAEANEEAAGRIIALSELMHYRDESNTNQINGGNE